MGCSEYLLNDNDLKWQPYQIDDILVFKSEENLIDSIKIVEIQSYRNPEDNLSFTSPNHESLFVNGELLNPSKDKQHLKHVPLLKLYADQVTKVNFILERSYDTLTYAKGNYETKELSSFNISKYSDNACLNDVIEIKPNYTGGINYQFDLESYLWSKKHGYIKCSFKNGKFFKLEKLIRNGTNILPECGR
jgi:hypothetical protein